MNFRTLIPLLCLIALVVSNAQNYQPVKHFKVSKLFDTTWYELLYADNSPGTLSACTRVEWLKIDDKHMTYKLGQWNPGLEGDFVVEGANLIRDKNYEGRFAIADAPKGSYVYILDYDPDYDWIIWANNYTFGGFISVLSKTPQNLDALARVLELAAKYQQNSDHFALQTSKCPYSKLLSLLDKAQI